MVGGAVLIESMSCARPVIAVDYGGPGELVDDVVGKAIPATNSETVAADLTEALRDLQRNQGSWKQKGLEGRRRAEELYSWDAKVDRAVELYREILPQFQNAESETADTRDTCTV
ncbi:MAG: glycosyltransferase [Planctomycetota bacterium]